MTPLSLRPASGSRRRAIVIAAWLAGLALAWCSLLGAQIVAAGETASGEPADVAVVLGAAVHGERPSPVFEERIRHGIRLYKARQVKRLLFTGGRGKGARAEAAESLVAARYARAAGVPPTAIFAETLSHTTRQNLFYARQVIRAERLGRALIVTDPLHMKRALRMSADLGIDARPSPTPSTRYRTWRSKTGFLLREIYFYNVYLVTGQ